MGTIRKRPNKNSSSNPPRVRAKKRGVEDVSVREKRQMSTSNLENSRSVRTFTLGEGITTTGELWSELIDMTDVLLGRERPPINHGALTLYETADAYYARAAELTMLIQHAEREQQLPRNHHLVKFRTGELRTFMDLAKRAADLGSRRLTEEQILLEKERLGRESR